ncbi:universal stress protein [uncultured Psychroserpens sp.]|uniref:universal stress protein n=1 Tax=uncultured Psychroserpens sp. TaxID=255436 RepID=UPI002636EA4F|nr:universal stress protein [uncultured Psychroserpens sp.]
MNKIILPVDFSKHSEYALETAAALARKHNAQLIVMNMLELSESIFSESSSDRQEEMLFMLASANKTFESFLDKDYLSGIDVVPMIKHHKVFKEVDTVAKQEGADLIVMGSRGHSDHDGIFTGSNTEKVVRHSDTPVLVVKSKNTNVDFDNIVLATDFSEDSIPAFQKASNLLNVLGNNVTLLHVNTPHNGFQSTDEIETKANQFLEKADAKNWKESIKYTSDYSIEDGVLNHSKKTGAHLLAMTTHGRTGLSHFFGGSISEDVVNHAVLPVITFKL